MPVSRTITKRYSCSGGRLQIMLLTLVLASKTTERLEWYLRRLTENVECNLRRRLRTPRCEKIAQTRRASPATGLSCAL